MVFRSVARGVSLFIISDPYNLQKSGCPVREWSRAIPSANPFSDYDLMNRPRRASRFIVEGRWAVEALLESEFHVHSILIVEGQHEDLRETVSERLTVLSCSKAEVQQLTGFEFHRGVMACAERPQAKSISGTITRGGVIACPEIADESNLGSIVRNAAAFGAIVVVQANHGADIFSRKAIRSSAGTVFRIPVFESPDLFADVSKMREAGFTIIGTSLEDNARNLREVAPPKNYVCLLGSEGAGLDAHWLDACDIRVTIPMASGVNSLNVASSSAILLYELSCPRE